MLLYIFCLLWLPFCWHTAVEPWSVFCWSVLLLLLLLLLLLFLSFFQSPLMSKDYHSVTLDSYFLWVACKTSNMYIQSFSFS